MQNLEVGQQTLENNLNQKISGIRVEDEDGNSFDDINSLAISGATLADSGGTQEVNLNIKPKITVANGQEPGSSSVTGNAIVIDGTTVESDPNDPNVIIVGLPPSSTGGIELDNGTANVAGVTKINVPTSEILAKGSGEVDLIPYIKANTHTGNPALIEELNVLPPIQLIPKQGEQYKYDILINPAAYETKHGDSCLLKLDMVESIAGQKPHNIYMTEEVVPTGIFFNLNSQNQGIDVQDNTGGDTALTGGQLTEALVKVEFLDSAPEDGNVKVWLEYKDPSDPIDKKILLDVNGVPLAVEKQFKANDKIGYFVLAGGFLAKATQTLKVVVETSFSSNSKITLDPLNTMACLNQFGDGYETSIARIEFCAERHCR